METDSAPMTHEACRYCHGDDKWTDWQPCTAEQAARYERDDTFKVRPLRVAPKAAPAVVEAVPLNFDQLQKVMSKHFGGRELTDDEADSAEAFARAIERAHGIAPQGSAGEDMTIERRDPDTIDVLGGKPGDKERAIESDYLIRSGMCPNGHGLMQLGGWGQECPACGFTCNTLPELTRQ